MSFMSKGACTLFNAVVFGSSYQAEDERFSWKNLAYIGQHWDIILDSQAADAKLSKLTREKMEDLLRSILVPEGTAGVLHVPRELYTPFVLGQQQPAYQESFVSTDIYKYMHRCFRVNFTC